MSHEEVLVRVAWHWLEGPVELPLLVEEGEDLGEQVQQQHTHNHFKDMSLHKLEGIRHCSCSGWWKLWEHTQPRPVLLGTNVVRLMDTSLFTNQQHASD